MDQVTLVDSLLPDLREQLQVEDQGMEHRWGTRIPVDAPAELSTADGTVAGAIADVSLSGAYVRTRTRMPVLPRGGRARPAVGTSRT